MFFGEIDSAAKIAKALMRQKKVKLVAHYDADGLCSASIMMRALMREGVEFELRVLKQLTDAEIAELSVEESDFLVLADLGSGQVAGLADILGKTQVLILDHHDPVRKEHMNLIHINPLLFSEDEISASMVCYLFAKALDIRNTELIDLAVVGAIGDIMDEKWELKGLGRKILEEAETLGKISMERGMRLYGRNSRPLHKSLEYSTDAVIPGITGSESNAVQFLAELGIDLKEQGRFRKLKDLSLEEQQRLASAIIMERLKEGIDDAEDVFGDVYNLVGRPEELQDAREFATLLNACGRTGNYQVAVRLCMGDMDAISASWDIMVAYRQMLADGMNWMRDGRVSQRRTLTVIDGAQKIPDTIIGTLSSMALNSEFAEPGKLVVGFADAGNGKLKVSARMPRDLSFNLRDILVDAARAVKGEAGGHTYAAGALIDTSRKEEFIKAIENKISKPSE
ncbi:MAG: DHH family phosphoesterase [Candidatus Aenigmatarchaeota archaeon]